MTPGTLRERLSTGPPLLLDAATGTELTRRGVDTSTPLWSALALETAPGLLEALHREEVAAGAEIVTACTFRTRRRDAIAAGLPPARAAVLTRRAVVLARGSGARWVAGSLSPLEDCWRPDLVPAAAELAAEHAEHAERLAAAGVDLLLVETIGTARELGAAVRAALSTGLPVVACVTTDGAGGLLSGEPLEAAAEAVRSLPRLPEALGVNCVPARRLLADLTRLSSGLPGLPLAAYGNAGLPLDGSGERYAEPIEPEPYARLAHEWVRAGARVVGGCCGTRPAHTAALRSMLDAYGK